MIILITGTSHTGKTFLAQRMLEEYNYPYLSIDHLKMGLIRSGNTLLTPEDDEALTDYLWPIVREMVKTAIENRQNLIVEGCYIPSDWRQDFSEYELKSIRFVCLAMTDAYIDAHFDEIIRHASDIETRLYETDCTYDSLKADNHHYIDAFTRDGEQITLIDNHFEETLKTIVQHMRQIHRKRQNKHKQLSL
ncbi:MAG: adenylate kinase [Prevotella sp.]|nr:adenylate kinase [Prevotella sp.]